MVAPVTARRSGTGIRCACIPSSPHIASMPRRNFCAAGTTGCRSCVQSATVGKDSSEPPFAVHSMPTVRNRCACFLHDVSSRACACLQVLSTERKAVLCSFSSQVFSGAQQTVGADAKKNAACNLRQRKAAGQTCGLASLQTQKADKTEQNERQARLIHAANPTRPFYN